MIGNVEVVLSWKVGERLTQRMLREDGRRRRRRRRGRIMLSWVCLWKRTKNICCEVTLLTSTVKLKSSKYVWLFLLCVPLHFPSFSSSHFLSLFLFLFLSFSPFWLQLDQVTRTMNVDLERPIRRKRGIISDGDSLFTERCRSNTAVQVREKIKNRKLKKRGREREKERQKRGEEEKHEEGGQRRLREYCLGRENDIKK